MFRVTMLALLLLSLLFFSTTGVAVAQNKCGNTTEVDVSDFVDPNGLPSGREGPKPLTVDSTMVVYSVYGGTTDPPPMIPDEWKFSGRPIMDTLAMYEGGSPLNFLILRFENPVPLCNLARGWEAWERYRSGTGSNLLHQEALLVFLKDGEQHILMTDLILTLGPGVSPEEFKEKVFEKELVFREGPETGSRKDFVTLEPPRGSHTSYLDKDVFDVKRDVDTGVVTVRVKAARGIFPLRAANRIAAYGSIGNPGWISRVDPVFRPLVSLVRLTTAFEQLQLSAPPISMQKGEPISVPQLYAPGVRLRVQVDIARDKKGKPLFRLLTDASEFSEKMIKAFDPKIDKLQLKNMGPGCTQDVIPTPGKKYERTLFSCTFTMLTSEDYQIGQMNFRVLSIADGKEYEVGSDQATLLLRVYALRHKSQTDGVMGVRPLPGSSDRVFSKQVAAGRPVPVSPPGEFAVDFLVKYLVPPVDAFLKNPWETIRTKVSLYIIGAAVLAISSALVFGSLFGHQPLIAVLGSALWYAVVGVAGGLVLPLVSAFLGGYGTRFFFRIVSGKRVKNLTLEVLAGTWHIRLPAEPEALVHWVSSDKRTRLERVLAALRADELLRRTVDAHMRISLGWVKHCGSEALLQPFASILIRREMRKREAF